MVKQTKKVKVRYKKGAYSKTTAGTGWLMDNGDATPKTNKRRKSLADVIV